jgi:hypothetical protein
MNYRMKHYSPVDKRKDNDIIKAALHNQNYLQTTYDREHLENEISLKRKNIALWDNAEYQDEKNKEAIKNAKTRVQVDNTEETLNKNGKNTETTQAAINEKKNELAAGQAAQAIQEQRETTEKSEEVPGNANLFGDSATLINNIKQEVLTNSEIVDDENQNENPTVEKYLFSPTEFNFDKSPDEAKNKVIHGVRGLLDKLPENSSFEDLVRHVVKVQGEKTADQIYNALQYGWEKNGLPKVDYKAVYDKIFTDPLSNMLNGINNLVIQTKEQQEAATEKVEKEDLVKEDKPKEFDNNNQPVYVYTGRVTSESSPKLAFLTRLNDTITETDDEGKVIVSNEYTSDELNTGDYVNSLPLLDPDKFNEGDRIGN